jgi:hypothetical protein
MRAAPGAIAVGRAARAEDERRGRGLGGEAGTVREDEQAAVEALPKFHATARVGAAAGQLYPAGAEADGVVVGDAARVPTAQPGGEIARGRAPGAPGVSGRPREARVEVSEEGGEKGIGRLERAMPHRRNSLTRRSCGVCQKRSMRPLAWGECAAMRRQHAGLGHFLSAHRERLPCLHGVTLFLNSYGVTFL